MIILPDRLSSIKNATVSSAVTGSRISSFALMVMVLCSAKSLKYFVYSTVDTNHL